VAGDLDDGSTRIAQMVGRLPVQVRKPEKGTRPKVFYVEGDADALVPAAAPPPSSYMWASAPQAAALAAEAGESATGPRRTYGVKEQHRNSWGWKVSAYLWTKSIAAGAFLVPAVLAMLDPWHGPTPVAALALAVIALAVTGGLLVWDLRQPRRFLWTLTRPQWRSWLTRGSYVIAGYGFLLGLHVLAALLGRPVPRMVTGLTVLMAAGTAVYTAFLFGQSKGRDLWQSALLAPHLIVQAVTAGAAVFAPGWLLVLLPVNGLLVAGEVWGHHATEDARRAARLIQDDVRFSTGVLAMGHLLPLTLLWGWRGAAPLAGALVLLGLLAWEHLYVQAPQQVPLA
jgi:formate-dependent nitrite reductase membrane component NrfD